jgi:1,2-diacylglycerol 3-alpha-glucosyltransferase
LKKIKNYLMRIGIFTNNYLPNPYGVTGSVESFRKVLESQGPACNAARSTAGRHEVFIFAPRWKGYVDENPRVFRYPSIDIKIKFRFPLAIPCSRKIDKILENLDLDIIHSQHPNLLGAAAAKWVKKKKIPLIFTWHTLYDQYAHFAPFIPRQLAAWWTIRNARNYANACDQVIVPTKSIKTIIEDWGVTNKNVIDIQTGVEENQLSGGNRNKIRKKYGIAEDEILLLVITRLTSEKNMEFLLDSVLPILEKNPKVKFLIGGGGYLITNLKKKSVAKNLQDRVIFTNTIANDIKKDYYVAGDIFVFASKSETQGMVITEAMYVGLPIVAVKATGAIDLVEENKNGFLVSEDKNDFAAAIQKLIDDKNLRKTFSAEAKKIAREKYTSNICAQKLLKVYEEAIRAKKVS